MKKTQYLTLLLMKSLAMNKTYRVDLKEITVEEFAYEKRNNSSIWIDGKRRDAVTDRYVYLDDIEDVQDKLEDLIIEEEAKAQTALNQSFKAKREATAKLVNSFKHKFGRL